MTGKAGGVDHDGNDTLFAPESSWLNDNRTPGVSRDQISARLKAAFGTAQVIWSKGA